MLTNKARRSSFATLALLCLTASLHAQGGCFESPEAPTGVLVLAGAASMFYGPATLRRIVRKIYPGNRGKL